MLCEFISRNNDALHILQNKHKVDIRPYPKEVLRELYEISGNVVKELSLKNDFARLTRSADRELASKVVKCCGGGTKD